MMIHIPLTILAVLPVLVFLPANDVTASICKKGDARKLNISAGHASFRKLVTESDIFVDKTLLIKDFIENPAQVILVTRPRRWGKSMNIDMIKTFFQIDVDKKGNRVDRNQAFNYQLFQLQDIANATMTKLNIALHPDIMSNYLGQHPVIHVSFHTVCDYTYKGVLTSMKNVIARAFEEHLYLVEVFWATLNSPTTSEEQKKTTKTHIDLFLSLFSRKAPEKEMTTSLKFLSERLHAYFGKKAIILMDEHDKVLKEFFCLKTIKVENEDIYLTVEYLYQLMSATFLGNDHLEKGLIVGVMRIATQSLFYGFSNFKQYHMVETGFSQHFGFTQDEVLCLFEEFDVTGRLSKEAFEYYGGYYVKNDVTTYYNSWSVIRFLYEKVVRGHWEETRNVAALSALFEKEGFKGVILTLAGGGSYEVELGDLSLSVVDYLALKSLLDGKVRVTESSVKLFLRLLFSEGYLTIAKDVSSKKPGSVFVKVPNGEVALQLKRKLAN